IDAPIFTNTRVISGRGTDGGYEVITDQGMWTCESVVVASGGCNLPVVPELAAGLPGSVAALTSMDYRSPDQLAEHGVLVVGGSATGVQLAEEIRASGQPVTLALGEHVRLP